MSAPSEKLAVRLEVLAAILRHPSGKEYDETFRRTFEEFNALRSQFPALLTDQELSQQMKEAHEVMNDMRARPYNGDCGTADFVSDNIERLEVEHQRRFG